jgi:hypothetical protein
MVDGGDVADDGEIFSVRFERFERFGKLKIGAVLRGEPFVARDSPKESEIEKADGRGCYHGRSEAFQCG